MFRYVDLSGGEKCTDNVGRDGEEVLTSAGMISASEFFGRKSGESPDKSDVKQDDNDKAKVEMQNPTKQ